jgi:hypothetical protein
VSLRRRHLFDPSQRLERREMHLSTVARLRCTLARIGEENERRETARQTQEKREET